MVRTLLLLLASAPVFGAPSRPSVTIDQGPLLGTYQTTIGGRTITAFKGIPYAQPPTGQLRFQEPVPAGKWPATLNATHDPPDCLQYSHVTYHFPYCPVTGSEDCLYINIFTPKLFDGSETKLMDVVFYIHPGSWMYFGSVYQGPEILLDRDVVFVTFNFRLGPLGFLSTGDSVVPGNNGLKDQVLALKWVQKNIEAFGGDPRRVTIAGLSSGAASVHYHMLSPLSKGLFRHAISMSGTALCPWALAENIKEKAQVIADQLGCPTKNSKQMVDCLKTRPAQQIVGLSKLFIPWLYNPYSPFGPVVEPQGSGAFISEPPLHTISRGGGADVPWLVSFTSEEGLYPAAEVLGTDSYVDELERGWDELLPHLLDYNYTLGGRSPGEVASTIKQHYGVNLRTPQGKMNFIKMISDRLYLRGISDAAVLHGKTNTKPIYMYEFSYLGKYSVADTLTKFKVKEHYGVCHGDDVLYLMPMPWFNIKISGEDSAMSASLRDLWVDFVTNGKLEWRTVNENIPKVSYTRIRSPEDLEVIIGDQLGEKEFWSSLALKEDNIGHIRDEL